MAWKSGAKYSCDRPEDELTKNNEPKLTRKMIIPEIRDFLPLNNMNVIPYPS